MFCGGLLNQNRPWGLNHDDDDDDDVSWVQVLVKMVFLYIEN
jgi:hypothetical protein